VVAGLPTPVEAAGSDLGSSSDKWFRPALLVVVGLGLFLRLAALVGSGGVLQIEIDYDEGVYSAAGSLLAHGTLPYRDFVFVQPPGIVYVLAPLGWLGPSPSLVAGRILMVVVSAASILLVGLVTRRAWGSFAGLAASAVYATFPEAVSAEHGIFLEPLLNALSLAALACWLRGRSGDGRAPWGRSWLFVSGVFAALAVGFKLWAVLLVLALATAPPAARRGRQLGQFALGFVAMSTVLWVPAVLCGPSSVFRYVVEFQLDRPPDEVVDRLERLRFLAFDWSSASTVLHSRHPAATILVLGAVALGLWRRRFGVTERIASVWLGLLLIAFLTAAPYWDSSNAALAPSAALLAGFVASPVPALLRRRGVGVAVALPVILMLIAAVGLGARQSWTESREARVSGGESTLVAAEIRRYAPAQDCVLSYEPGFLLESARLPLADASFEAVDTYAAQLMEVLKRLPYRPASTEDAFREQPYDKSMLEQFARCRYVALGSSGVIQMGPAGFRAFAQAFEPVTSTGMLWVRKSTR
jgi:Glycosyltransferase family 87